MGLFEYVIVLRSIVIGLALTHLMQGVARLDLVGAPDLPRCASWAESAGVSGCRAPSRPGPEIRFPACYGSTTP
jgi:hypothetical protein